MKQLISALVMFIIMASVNAQKNFQGEITYKLHSNFEQKADAELKVLFGVNKLKLQFKEKETYDRNEVLILLDSSATYTLNRDDKTFSKKLLLRNSLSVRPLKKSFNGYGSTLIQPDDNVIGALLLGMAGSSNTFLYVSDSLFYTVPEALASNIEFSMLQKNKIVLAAEMEMKNNFDRAGGDTATKQITIEAIAIQPMTINDAEFTIPSNYENIINKTVEAPTMAAEAPVDSAVAVPQQMKKPLKKKSPGSGKTKTVNKPGAIRRKQ